MGNWQKGSAWPLLTVLMTVLFLLGGVGRAEAQVERLPVWAVVEFENKGPQSAEVGKAAASAVSIEISKLVDIEGKQKYDVLPIESVARSIDDLGLKIPITRASDLSRLGLALGCGTVVSGEVINFRIESSGSDKQAQVLLRVFIKDVASGITINGAAVSGRSGFRASTTEASALISEAMSDGAFKAIREVESRQIPPSTVTSTLDGKALLDRGLRDGLKGGMSVIVTRGREQVAVGRITSVDDDSAVVTPNTGQVFKGIRSGDKVRVVFDVATLSPNFGANGDAKVNQPRKRSSNQGLISILVLVVILGLLLGQGRSGSTELLKVRSQAYTGGDDVPSVRVSWTRDTFLRNNNIVRFQVWRDDISTGPVAVVNNPNATFVDDRADLAYQPGAGNPATALNALPTFGNAGTCISDDETDDTSTATPVQSGRPYRHSVEAVYRIPALDIPNPPDDAEFCYFMSTKVSSQGSVTPFRRTVQRAPLAEFSVPVVGPAAGRVTFQYDSNRAASGGSAVAIEYVIQTSPSPTFSSRTSIVDTHVDTSTAFGSTITRTSVNILSQLQALTAADNGRLYWRVGVRNVDDSVQPEGGYIFSAARSLKRADTP